MTMKNLEICVTVPQEETLPPGQSFTVLCLRVLGKKTWCHGKAMVNSLSPSCFPRITKTFFFVGKKSSPSFVGLIC